MTVQELFKKVPFDDFFEAFCRHDSEFYSIMLDKEPSLYDRMQKVLDLRRALQAGYEACINEPAVPSGDVVFVIPTMDDGHGYLHSCLIQEEDLQKPFNEIEAYAYEFEPAEIILGYRVSEGSLYALEEAEVAYGIFEELSFFGLPCSEKSDNEKTKIQFEINEAVKEIEEKGPENCGVSMTDLFKEIGFVDERTDEQKQFDLDRMRAEGAFYTRSFELQFGLTDKGTTVPKKNEKDS